jgi:FG-GAP repeat
VQRNLRSDTRQIPPPAGASAGVRDDALHEGYKAGRAPVQTLASCIRTPPVAALAMELAMNVNRAALLIALLLVASVLASAQITQLAELTASDGTAGDQFGTSVAADGTTVIVGAPQPSTVGPGAAYVFGNSGASWSQLAKLTSGASSGEFGFSVAISGDVAVVGAPGGLNANGTAYVFVKPSAGWTDMTPTAQLSAVGNDENYLGNSVAVSTDGKTVVIGSPGYGFGTGNVYIFERPVGGWIDMAAPTATLSSSAAAGLGNAVAIAGSGNVVCAGSLGGEGNGAAYVFLKPQSGWQNMNPTATLTASDGGPDQHFATSVAISSGSGNTIAVGTPFHPPNSGAPGTVYVFAEPPSGWLDMTQTAELTLPINHQTMLGESVAVQGNWVLAGAPEAAVSGKSDPGEIFGYSKPSGGWQNTTTPNLSQTSSDGATNDLFGWSAALNGTLAVVGAPQHTVSGNANQGAAYIFGPK